MKMSCFARTTREQRERAGNPSAFGVVVVVVISFCVINRNRFIGAFQLADSGVPLLPAAELPIVQTSRRYQNPQPWGRTLRSELRPISRYNKVKPITLTYPPNSQPVFNNGPYFFFSKINRIKWGSSFGTYRMCITNGFYDGTIDLRSSQTPVFFETHEKRKDNIPYCEMRKSCANTRVLTCVTGDSRLA